MNKGEFIEMLAECMGESKAAAARCLDCVLDCLMAAVKKSEKVALSGFGSFEIKKRKARMGVNPATGEKMKFKASKSVGFKPAKAFKDAL